MLGTLQWHEICSVQPGALIKWSAFQELYTTSFFCRKSIIITVDMQCAGGIVFQKVQTTLDTYMCMLICIWISREMGTRHITFDGYSNAWMTFGNWKASIQRLSTKPHYLRCVNTLRIMQFDGKLPMSASLNMVTVIMALWLGLACKWNMRYQEKMPYLYGGASEWRYLFYIESIYLQLLIEHIPVSS